MLAILPPDRSASSQRCFLPCPCNRPASPRLESASWATLPARRRGGFWVSRRTRKESGPPLRKTRYAGLRPQKSTRGTNEERRDLLSGFVVLVPFCGLVAGAGAEFRFRLPLHDHERDVVGGARALRELRQRRLNSIANPGRRRIDIPRNNFIQPRRAKLLSTRTNRLSHTIRIHNKHIALL